MKPHSMKVRREIEKKRRAYRISSCSIETLRNKGSGSKISRLHTSQDSCTELRPVPFPRIAIAIKIAILKRRRGGTETPPDTSQECAPKLHPSKRQLHLVHTWPAESRLYLHLKSFLHLKTVAFKLSLRLYFLPRNLPTATNSYVKISTPHNYAHQTLSLQNPFISFIPAIRCLQHIKTPRPRSDMRRATH